MLGFFEKLKAAVVSMWHKAPAIAVWIASAINQLVPVIEQLDEIVDPELALVLNPILDKVKVGLTALKVTVANAGEHATAQALVASVATNLDALLNVAEVKDAALRAKIAGVVAIAKAEILTIHAALPAVSTLKP